MKKKVFISYSYKDREYAQNLAKVLQQIGFEAKPEFPIASGEDIAKNVKKGLNKASTVIVLVSNNWVNSKWTNVELGAAFGTGKKIIPILISKKLMEIPFFIDQTNMLDATKTKDFSAIVTDLETELNKK